ncbi:hypothetical protein [Sphingomonas sp.]|uniref:hypothetical protein n=1 Tax=Sphingomonas sp. TaxID=28214 RepID=UPI002DD66114|nr:hypothetical protein [Sphingomonas sp.]
MTADPALAAARARAIAARARLDASIERAKTRLSPRTLAAGAVETAKDKAFAAAETGLDAVRQRPAVAAAVAGAVGLFLARKPLLGLFDHDDATADEPTS